MLCWDTKGEGCVRVAKGWPGRCSNIPEASWVAIVALNSSANLIYSPVESKFGFGLLVTLVFEENL